jgi:hypothetical protein
MKMSVRGNETDNVQLRPCAAPLSGPGWRDGYAAEVITELDLAVAGVTSVIWALGYIFDFSWVRLPVLDGDGYPVQQRGVTALTASISSVSPGSTRQHPACSMALARTPATSPTTSCAGDNFHNVDIDK